MLVSGPLMAVAIEHLLPTRAGLYWRGLGYQPHPWIPLANCSLPPTRYVLQWWIKQCFPLKVAHPLPRVWHHSQLRCTVLTLPASSFTSYVGMPSATWWTTTYSVSLHQSLTFRFPSYMSLFITTTSPDTNCMVLMVLS